MKYSTKHLLTLQDNIKTLKLCLVFENLREIKFG